MEGDDRRNLVLPATGQHAPVMVEGCGRKLAFLGFDPGPFDAEAERIQPKPGHQRNVLPVAVIEIARVAGWLHTWGTRLVLPFPPVAVRISALDLMCRLRRAEQEAVGEGRHSPYIKALLTTPRWEYPRRRQWASRSAA